MRRKPARTFFTLSRVTVSVSKSRAGQILIQIATKSNLEIMNQRKYRGDFGWTGIDCVTRWLINLVSMLVVNSEYIRNTQLIYLLSTL